MKRVFTWALIAGLSFGGFAPAALAVNGRGGTNLIISEVVDGPLSGGLPKFVELTNCGAAPVDLSQYSIGNINNGGTTLGGGSSLLLSGNLNAGESYVISYESGDSPGVGTFFDVFGMDPDNFDLSTFINGDDVIVLYLGQATGDGSDATLVDILGVIGVNGDGEPWDYTDSYITRNAGALASQTFVEADWTGPGADGLEDVDDAAETVQLQTLTTPGSHVCAAGPAAAPATSTTGIVATVGVVFLLLGAGLGTRRFFG